MMSILKIIDDAHHKDVEDLGIDLEIIQSLNDIVASARAAIGLSDDDITSARRGLRKALLENASPSPLRMLHRSQASRILFNLAVQRAIEEGSDELTLVHLLEELLEHLPNGAMRDFGNRKLVNPQLPSISTDAMVASHGPQIHPMSTRRGSKTPTIDAMSRDLTALAREERLPQIVGRKREMTAMARHLLRTMKRNVLVVGDAGVGKTAIVEGLAQRLVSQDAPENLRSLRIVQLSVADLVSGTRYRGDMEERLQRIIAEATSNSNLVLFLDEIHLAIGAGACIDAPMDVGSILKPALSRDDFRCIGATTTEEFERYIKSDTAFLRRFQVLRIQEPSEQEALQICREWARRIERIQGVVIGEEAIEASVQLSARLIRGRSLPDKAIDLLENAATFVKVSSLTKQISAPAKEPQRVSRKEIEVVLEEQYGKSVAASMVFKPDEVKSTLQTELVGQDDPISALVEALAALEAREEDGSRPLGVFMFTGPTGVGKTFAAELIGRALFGGGGKAFGRFNMNEYKERHELARLIGAPPGFVGHEHYGVLFRFAESNPQGLILLDEMEKAHPEIQDYFLQIFDKGEARDSRGRLVDFRRHLFVMTCNLVSTASSGRRVGFRVKEVEQAKEELKDLDAQLTAHFRPEFLARIDRIIAFRMLTIDDYQVLFNRVLEELQDRVKRDYRITVEITDEARRFLCERCADQKEGARGFIRLFERVLAAPLIEHVKRGEGKSVVRLCWENDALRFSK